MLVVSASVLPVPGSSSRRSPSVEPLWIQRRMRAFGSPSLGASMELCGWGRVCATRFTCGVGMSAAGTPMPDLENASCILFWGYNPSLARLPHATAAVAALRRGARRIVV